MWRNFTKAMNSQQIFLSIKCYLKHLQAISQSQKPRFRLVLPYLEDIFVTLNRSVQLFLLLGDYFLKLTDFIPMAIYNLSLNALSFLCVEITNGKVQ